MRKMAISELAFRELELFADGCSSKEIKDFLGHPCNTIRVKDSFFRIVNFRYDGMFPEDVVPKFSAEELCKKAYERGKYNHVSFRNNTPITDEDFLRDDFVCGCSEKKQRLSLDDDIRYLDLSVITFNPIVRCYSRVDLYGRGVFGEEPFTIRSLVNLGEKGILNIHRFGAGGLTDLKEELAKHGFELGGRKPALEDVIDEAQKSVSSLDDNFGRLFEYICR